MPSKLCSKCGAKCGVRTKECSCGQSFAVKVKKATKHKLAETNWKELVKGDKIKIINGSGPYYLDKQSEKFFYGERGIVKVDKIIDKGICGYNENGSCCFIYMGESYISKTGTYMEPHKIKKIKI